MDIPIYPIFAPSVLHSIPFSVLQMPIFIVDYHFCLAISTLLDGHSAGLIILLSWFYHLCLLAKSNALVTMSPLVAMFSVAYIAVSRWPNHMFTCFLSKYNFLDMKLPKITLWSLCCSCLHPHHISSSRGRENSLKQVIKTHVPSFWGYQFWLAISPFMIAIHLAIKPTKKWFLKDRLLYISPQVIYYTFLHISPHECLNSPQRSPRQRSSKPVPVRPGDVAPTAATPPRPGRAFAPPRPTGGSTSPSYLGRLTRILGEVKTGEKFWYCLEMIYRYLNRGSMNVLNLNEWYLIAGIGADRVTVTFTYRILFWG